MATASENNWDDFSKASTVRKLGLKVEDKIFWVSREKLAKKSSVFNTMLFGEFQEAKKDVIDLKDKDPDAILELLRCLFTIKGKAKEIDGRNLDIILQLADEYQIELLLKKCSEFIKTNIMGNLNQMARGFKIAFRYKFGDVVRYGIKQCSGRTIGNLLPYLSEFPIEVRYLISLSIAGQAPGSHDVEEISDLCNESDDDDDDGDNDSRDFSSMECAVCTSSNDYYDSRPVRVEFCCRFCEFAHCGHCEEPDGLVCTVCHVCCKELGSTEFCCDCVDGLIISELEKLGF